MAFCKRCLLPDKVPGADLNEEKICKFCREYEEKKKRKDLKKLQRIRELREQLEQLLKNCRGEGDFDCLVPVSGGKDSLYLLYKLKVEYKLRVLAFTVNVNIPGIAWENIRRTIKILDIPHITYTPSVKFYKKLFKYLLKNQEERGAVYTVSYVYAPLFEGDAIRLAIEKKIPLILAGYSPGQPDPSRMFFEFSPKLIKDTDWTPPELRKCGKFSEEELKHFYNPKRYPHNTKFPRYIAPFHVWSYNQNFIMREVKRLGLVKSSRHANPIFTNYPINWLLMYSDLKHFGYNPYHPEFSALIREGKASRNYWLVMTPIINFMIKKRILLGNQVNKSLKWLGLTEEELKITKPRGAYDPVTAA